VSIGALRVDVAGRAARFRYQTVDGRARDEFRVRLLLTTGTDFFRARRYV